MCCRGVVVVVERTILQPLEGHTSQINGHHCKWIATRRGRVHDFDDPCRT